MSPSEEIFLIEQPDAPATMEFELRVSGTIDDAGLRAAVASAVATHPMSQARLVARRFLLRPPLWEIGGDHAAIEVVQAAHCEDDGQLRALRDEFFSRPISLLVHPALRVLIVHRPGGDTLMFSIHHSLMDGIGGLRWINSVARAYTGRPDPVPKIDVLAIRDIKRQFGANIPADAVIVDPHGPPRGRGTRISGTDSLGKPGYGICHVALSEEECARLDPCRHGQDATLNDLLIAALHATIAGWNAQHGETADCISILMPSNLRPLDWNNEVVANLVLTSHSVTTPADRADPRSLLAAVTAQMHRLRTGYIKILTRSRLTCWLFANVLLPCMLWLPRVVEWGSNAAIDAILFANLGRIERRVGNFGPEGGELTEFWVSPPVPMPVGLGIDSAILRGRLFFSLRYCRARFDPATAQRFCSVYVATLLSLGEREP